MSRSWTFVCWLILGLLTSHAAAEEDIVVRAKLDPADSVWVGQRVQVQVDVLAKDAWARLPNPPSIEVAGAVVYRPPTQSVRLTETLDESSYTGQRYEWWIYPQRTGQLSVPPLRLKIERKVFGDESATRSVEKSTESLPFQVRSLEGDGDSSIVVAPSLDARQEWTDVPNELFVGDGLTRTIVRQVGDAPALTLPPIDFESPDGVRVLVKQPQTENRLDRGTLTGSRTDEATYLFESPGEYELPSISLPWSDLESEELRSLNLEGRTVTVVSKQGVEDTPANQSSEPTARVWGFVGISVPLFCLLGGVIIWWNFVRIEAWATATLRSVSQSEPLFYYRLKRAAGTGDAARILQCLSEWSDKVQADAAAPCLSALFKQFGDDEVIGELEKLTRCFDAGEAFDAGRLMSGVRRVRKRIRKRDWHRRGVAASSLPELV